jgi:hypothetical protein
MDIKDTPRAETRARHLGSTTFRVPRKTLHPHRVARGREKDPAEMQQAALAKKAHVAQRAAADSR